MKRYLLEVDDKATAELNEKSFTLNGQPAFGLRVLANEISLEVLPTDKPITKEDLAKAQEKGQNEAWELAQKIMKDVVDGGYTTDDLRAIFEKTTMRYSMCAQVINENTYQEVVDKIKAWEEEKKAIHVGDIVELEWGGITHRAVVTKVTVNWLSVVLDDGNVVNVGISRCKKTSESVAISDILDQLNKEEK